MKRLRWEKTVFPNKEKAYLKSIFEKLKSSWFLVFVLVIGTFYLYFYKENTPLAWVPCFIAIALFIAADFLYNKFKYIRGLLIKFIYPLFLALLVLVFGSFGFQYSVSTPSTYPSINDIYKAANLITLNSSDFSNIEQECINESLKVARFLGAFLAAYAFLLAFSLAVGKENLSRLSFRVYRTLNKANKNYVVVIGDGQKALSLAYDLISCGRRFVFLDGSDTNEIRDSLADANCWYFRGKPWNKVNLNKLFIDKAKEVFVLCESDEDNFRTVQEMDDLSSKENQNNTVEWYVHFNDLGFRDSIHKLLHRRSAQLNTFCVEALASIKLLKNYPVYRRYDKEFATFNIAIVGFNRQAQELLFELFQTCHFKSHQITHIHIYYKKEEKKTVDEFLLKYSVFNHGYKHENFYSEAIKEVLDYTFANIKVGFSVLPESEIQLRSQFFSLYTFFSPQTSNNLYVCIDNGMKNVEFLKISLPIMFYQKTREQRDIQVFCYYNYPDKEEQEYIQIRLNEIAPNIQIICFGNMLDACGLKSIENKDDLNLAKRIALIYHILNSGFKVDDPILNHRLNHTKVALEELDQAYNKNSIVIDNYESQLESNLKALFVLIYSLPDYSLMAEKNWQSITEIDRLSNIRAANHAKIKHLLYERYSSEEKSVNWESNVLHELGEIEHRRWNAEKLLTGWLPYLDDQAWTEHKKSLRAQKYHNFLVPYSQLPPLEQSKDWVQVMGIVETATNC